MDRFFVLLPSVVTAYPQSAHLQKTVRIRKSYFVAGLIINLKKKDYE